MNTGQAHVITQDGSPEHGESVCALSFPGISIPRTNNNFCAFIATKEVGLIPMLRITAGCKWTLSFRKPMALRFTGPRVRRITGLGLNKFGLRKELISHAAFIPGPTLPVTAGLFELQKGGEHNGKRRQGIQFGVTAGTDRRVPASHQHEVEFHSPNGKD